MFWILLMIALVIVVVFCVFYIADKICKFYIYIRLMDKSKKSGVRWIAYAEVVLFLIFLVLAFNPWNAGIVYIHLMIFWWLSEKLEKLYRKIKKLPKDYHFKRYYAGYLAMFLTVTYLAYAAMNDYHVREKDYAITTEKDVDQLRVAMIADSHIGTTFDGEGFARHLKKIEEANPDLLIIAGDFVDDDTTYKDMERACSALGEFKCKYGVYYAFGNHDKGYYDSRGYSAENLRFTLEQNNVNVLEDQAVLVDNFYVVGRRDSSDSYRGVDRKDMESLTDHMDMSRYVILVDHQPNAYEEEAASGVDLVLSGHTHGGQLFPVNIISAISRINDKVYGLEKRGNTNFIVTSGISDWAIKYKTGCKSEFVIVDITKQ